MTTVFVVPVTGVQVPNVDVGPNTYIDAAGESVLLTDYIQRRIDDGDLIESTPNGPAWQDFVVSEGPGQVSRDTITVASGSGALVAGTVMGQSTATTKWHPSPDTATDGTEDAAGVLLYPVDATSGDVTTQAVTWSAELLETAITYDASVNNPTKEAAKAAQLRVFGIKLR